MGKTQILVVEDEDTSARLIEMTLKSWGYVVPAVIPSGEEAIKKAGEVHPDLVLMDICLKGDVDGVQAAEEIYTRFNIPVVYLTAYADNKILQRAKITEPYGYILKPFQQRELHTTIDIALYKHKADSKLKEREQALEKLSTELKTNNEQLQHYITERKKVEEGLQQSEENLRAYLESAPDGVYLNDLKGKFLYGNKKAEEITGYKREDLIGKSFLKLHLLPKKHLVKAGKLLALNAMGRPTGPDEFELIRKDGCHIWVEITTTPIKQGGEVLVIGSVRDITERKQLEHALNERVKELQCLYGIASIAERPEITLDELYQEVANILPPSWRYPEVTCARIVISGKEFKTENCRDTEWRQSSDIKVDGVKTGVVETCYLEERPEIDEGPFLKEERLLINAVAQRLGDITERKKAQQAQERLSQQLQIKVSELEALSYSIAHDLKSPMLSIEGFSRLLRADIQNQKMERIQEDIRLLESGVSKMQQFINRTLEYSRAGYLVKRTENVPFGDIVKEVITEFTEQMSSIGATVSVAETFPRVYADRMRIVQALTNLIQNSIKYRDKTVPLKIEIGYWLSKDEVVFFVRDNGLGIDASETEKVFALFYRGTADGEGSGAGLAIVKRIIEAHGGRIWAQGQSGKGTTMCFTLPQQSGTNKGDNNGEN